MVVAMFHYGANSARACLSNHFPQDFPSRSLSLGEITLVKFSEILQYYYTNFAHTFSLASARCAAV